METIKIPFGSHETGLDDGRRRSQSRLPKQVRDDDEAEPPPNEKQHAPSKHISATQSGNESQTVIESGLSKRASEQAHL